MEGLLTLGGLKRLSASADTQPCVWNSRDSGLINTTNSTDRQVEAQCSAVPAWWICVDNLASSDEQGVQLELV